jgi:outer membrane autotransporter protein
MARAARPAARNQFLAYAFHTIDTDRTIAFPGFFDRTTAHYQGGTGQIFGEVGYGFAFGKLTVEPFASAARVRLDTDVFSEQGEGGAERRGE